LGSFAYNLLTCWLQTHTQNLQIEAREARLSQLLRHNFKKFYAEQLLRRLNNCFSRAILLETLLFEQQMMIPVFAARETDALLDARVTAAASLMTGLTANHEIGHYFCENYDGFWSEFLVSQPPALCQWFEQRCITYPHSFVDELKCDWIAWHSILQQPSSALSREEILRGIVFGFAAFAVLYSLDKSAVATTDEQSKRPDGVDLRSLKKHHHDETYIVGRDLDFMERAAVVRELASLYAAEEGLTLFTDETTFPLPADILERLLDNLDMIMDSYDSNARSMSMLVAESLHGHSLGTEYLYLRSKVFASNRAELSLD
jgi:hypothetical protein